MNGLPSLTCELDRSHRTRSSDSVLRKAATEERTPQTGPTAEAAPKVYYSRTPRTRSALRRIHDRGRCKQSAPGTRRNQCLGNQRLPVPTRVTGKVQKARVPGRSIDPGDSIGLPVLAAQPSATPSASRMAQSQSPAAPMRSACGCGDERLYPGADEHWVTSPSPLSLPTTTRASAIEISMRLCSNLSLGIDERPTPLPGDDHATASQYLHGTADGRIRNAVLLGQLTFTRKLDGDLPVAYPPLNVVSDLHIRVFLGHGINRTGRHKINIGAL